MSLLHIHNQYRISENFHWMKPVVQQYQQGQSMQQGQQAAGGMIGQPPQRSQQQVDRA